MSQCSDKKHKSKFKLSWISKNFRKSIYKVEQRDNLQKMGQFFELLFLIRIRL